METVSIFVDVQNIYYTVKQQFNCHFDYTVFWEEVTRGRTLAKAVAYATDRGDERQIRFQNILKRVGFEVRLKPFVQRADGSAKGDWDVGIALDMAEHAKNVDTVILASGDGDFADVVGMIVRKFGVRVEVYGVHQLTASSLIQSASSFVSIEGDMLRPISPTW